MGISTTPYLGFQYQTAPVEVLDYAYELLRNDQEKDLHISPWAANPDTTKERLGGWTIVVRKPGEKIVSIQFDAEGNYLRSIRTNQRG